MIPKYKAWDKEEKIWLEIKCLGLWADNELWYLETEDDKHYFEDDLGVEWELLQSTGVKDKNGVEIFEGDIVKAVRKHSEPKLIEDRYCKGIITYSHGCYDIKVEPNVFSGLIPENLLTDIDLTIEVIGNIYENGDLL